MQIAGTGFHPRRCHPSSPFGVITVLLFLSSQYSYNVIQVALFLSSQCVTLGSHFTLWWCHESSWHRDTEDL